MQFKAPTTLLKLAGAVLCACLALDVSAASDEQLLQRYIDQSAQLEERQQDLQARLGGIQESMELARHIDSPEKLALDEASAAFADASEVYESEPSAENEARLRNAEFKLHLAERRYLKSNRELESLESEQDQIKSELADIRGNLATLNQKIGDQRERIAANKARAQASAQASANRQGQELQKAEAEREAARREVERLRALLDEQKADNPAPAAAKTKVVVAASSSATAASANSSVDARMELDDNFFLLTSADQVTAEKKRLETILDGKTRNLRTNKILNIRHFVDGKEAKKHSYRFKGLGNYQYEARAKLHAGENRLRVSSDAWTIQVPDAVANVEYVFLMDDSSGQHPRVVCYPAKFD